MKLTIAKKLWLGFGTIIALMALSTAVAYYNIVQMRRYMAEVIDKAAPTVRTCDRLDASITDAVAALRGFTILGDDPKQREWFLTLRKQAWDEANQCLARLSQYSADWTDPQDIRRIDEIRRLADQIAAAHQRIVELAHTDENLPAQKHLSATLDPMVAQLRDTLATMVQSERGNPETQHQRERTLAIAELQQTIAECMKHLRAFALSAAPADKEGFDKSTLENEADVKRMDGLVGTLTPEQRAHWNQFVQLRSKFVGAASQMFALRERDDWNRSEYLMKTESVPAAGQLKTALSALTASATARADAARADLQAASNTVVLALLGASLLAMALACAVALVLSRKIVGTVRVLADRAQEISTGNLTGSPIAAKTGDELGQLAAGFDVMLANLRDLTGQILSVTENVNSAASQISSSTRQQASSTKEQAATVQQITSTIQEISQSGSQIVEKAKEIAAASEAATTSSKSGMSAVQAMNRVMGSIREQVEEVAENIVALSEKTQAVGEIIATVNDIAEQSNLLALNATIEAAEAGEEGNRFSVVATEMKNLADQAKECTLQVRKILGEIQKGINTSVMLTEEAVKRVESGKQQADLSEETIRQLSTTTEESVQAFQLIIGATNQQQVGLDQVVKGMQDVDLATQQTATGTAQLEQAVVSLTSMSRQLQSAVAAYKV